MFARARMRSGDDNGGKFVTGENVGKQSNVTA